MRAPTLAVLAAVVLSTAGCAQMDNLFGGERQASGSAAGRLNERSTMSVASLSAQEMMGKQVLTERGERVGEVDDVLLRSRNRPSHVVVGVGGFLGVGERNVAVDVDRLRYSGERNALVVQDMSRDQIANLPEFRYDGSMVSLSRSRDGGSNNRW